MDWIGGGFAFEGLWKTPGLAGSKPEDLLAMARSGLGGSRPGDFAMMGRSGLSGSRPADFDGLRGGGGVSATLQAPTAAEIAAALSEQLRPMVKREIIDFQQRLQAAAAAQNVARGL